MKKLIYALALLCPLLSSCSTVTIRGNVLNTGGMPVVAATITIQETGNSTVSDNNGEFILKKTKPTDSLIITAPGYHSVTEPNNNRGLITVVLKRKYTVTPISRPLIPGDTFPSFAFSNLLNSPVFEIQSTDLPNKLIILDFWATWCNSCIKGFNRLDSLKQKFPTQLLVILVNSPTSSGNDQQTITDYIVKRKKQLHQLPIYIDTGAQLLKWFPHYRIPHYIWIGPGSKVIGITSSAEITSENIKAALENKPIKLEFKNDFEQRFAPG